MIHLVTMFPGKVYSRLLFGKMLLASSQYNRPEVKDDTLVSYTEECKMQSYNHTCLVHLAGSQMHLSR